MILPRAVTVHGLAQARAALEPGLPVLLLSAPGAACFAGAGWWRALMAAAVSRSGTGPQQLDALDCGNHPGRALEALQAGCGIVVLLPCPAFAAVASRTSALVLPGRPASLDLGQRGGARQLMAWLRDPNPKPQRDSEPPLG